MEILAAKFTAFGGLSKTSKPPTQKLGYHAEHTNMYNKENINDSARKERISNRPEDNSNFQARGRSADRRPISNTPSSHTYARPEPANPSVAFAHFGNFFNSPKHVEGELFKGVDKNSYRAKHMTRGLKTSFSKDEKSNQSTSNDQHLQTKIDQIINSSLSTKDRPKINGSATKAPPQNSHNAFEEKTSEKLTLYTRLLNDMRSSTPKGKENVSQEGSQVNSFSKTHNNASSSEYYGRNSESKKPYLDLKLSSVDFDNNSNSQKTNKEDIKTAQRHQRLSYSQKKSDKQDENVRPDRIEQPPTDLTRRDIHLKQERGSASKTLTVNTAIQGSASDSHFLKQSITAKNSRGGLRYNDNQSIYESLTNLKRSLDRPTNHIAKSATFNGAPYSTTTTHTLQTNSSHISSNQPVSTNNSMNRESKPIFKSVTPKANAVSSNEVKNILQSFKTVLQKDTRPNYHDDKQTSSISKKDGHEDALHHHYTRDSSQRDEEKSNTGSNNPYSQRPPSSSKSSKYRESSLNINRKPEEKILQTTPFTASQNSEREKAQPKSLKDFITQVNPADSLPTKAKLDINPQHNERQNLNNIQGHPQSAKNSTRGANNDKLLTVGSTGVMGFGKTASTTTNSSIAQESKSFSFNSSLINKHNSRNPVNSLISTQEEKVASAVCQYYMAGLEKYLRHCSTDNEYFSKIYREHFLQSYQAINFCKYLKQVDPAELAKKKVYLTKRESHKDRKTIIFDLDETLIHCNENSSIPSDVTLPIKFPHGDVIEAGINVRPYAIEALEELSKHFEIIVFTASHSCYANVVLDHLDPQRKYIHHRLFRENCVTTEEGLYIKDLRIFANRHLKDLVIVDNAMYSFGYQVENGIPIIPFYYNKTDRELKTLVPYLKSLFHVKDVREVNVKSFKLHHFTEFDNHDDVLRKIFG